MGGGFFTPQFLFAQSPNCLGAEPFCTGTSVSFPAATNTTSPVGPYYDCLFTQPNPAFYYLQIDQPGNITIFMQSTPLVDIDFIYLFKGLRTSTLTPRQL